MELSGQQLTKRTDSQTVINLIPPRELWPQFQSIRNLHLPNQRCGPHFSFVEPFIVEEQFPQVVSLLTPILAQSSAMLFAEPTIDPPNGLQSLLNAITQVLPHCTDQSKKSKDGRYKAHLSLARYPSEAALLQEKTRVSSTWKPVIWEVKEIYLLARRGDDPFVVRHVIQLGQNTLPPHFGPGSIGSADGDESQIGRSLVVCGFSKNFTTEQLSDLLDSQGCSPLLVEINKNPDGKFRTCGVLEFKTNALAIQALSSFKSDLVYLNRLCDMAFPDVIGGVFDGHNGSRCAEFISQRLPKNLLKDPDFKDHPELALTSAFILTNAQWFEAQSSQQDGSCALAALISRDCIYVANVGDSRAIISQGKQVLALSKDHKATDLEEVQMIEKLGGKVIGGRVEAVLAVSRAFGNLNYKERISCLPDVKLWTITNDTEFIVLACDGVWDVMNNEEVGLFVRKQLLDETTPEDVATNLALHCLQRRSLDNISVIIVSFLTEEKRLVLLQNLGGPPPVPFIQTSLAEPYPNPLRSRDTDTPPPFRRRSRRRLSADQKP